MSLLCYFLVSSAVILSRQFNKVKMHRAFPTHIYMKTITHAKNNFPFTFIYIQCHISSKSTLTLQSLQAIRNPNISTPPAVTATSNYLECLKLPGRTWNNNVIQSGYIVHMYILKVLVIRFIRHLLLQQL